MNNAGEEAYQVIEEPPPPSPSCYRKLVFNCENADFRHHGGWVLRLDRMCTRDRREGYLFLYLLFLSSEHSHQNSVF